MWSGRRLTKIQTTSRPDHIWPDAWTRIEKAAQRREKQEWAIEKPKLEYARILRGIYSIDPSDQELQGHPQTCKAKVRDTQGKLQCHVKERFTKACIPETVVSKNENQGVRWKEQIQLHYWSTWIHETKSRASDEKDSWRTHWRDRETPYCITI